MTRIDQNSACSRTDVCHVPRLSVSPCVAVPLRGGRSSFSIFDAHLVYNAKTIAFNLLLSQLVADLSATNAMFSVILTDSCQRLQHVCKDCPQKKQSLKL